MSKENRVMRLLGALGIIFIVLGHLEANQLSLFGLFPYYSFHVYIFLFLAGYFYKPEDESKIALFVFRKFKKLMIPYFFFNLVYGIVSTLLNKQGIYIGSGISLWNLLVEPFLGGHQFGFNSPAWFVPALFVVEIINVISRKILKKILNIVSKEVNHDFWVDTIALLTSIIVGVVTVYLAIGGHVYDYLKTPGRWLIMLFGIELGRFYRQYIEPVIDSKLVAKFGFYQFSIVELVLLICLEWFIERCYGGLNFSVVWCTSFANGPVIPFVTVSTGIFFWLRITRIIDRLVPLESHILDPLLEVGRRSYSIMTHHLFVLFLINGIFFLLYSKGFKAFSSFDMTAFNTSNSNYQYLYAGYHLTHIINALVCITIPTIVAKYVVK